jgi:CheY-like chemotaxis protein
MKVAIVDDEADMRQSISQWLALSGFDTETYASAEDALRGIGPEFPCVVVSDIKMPGMDGIETLQRIRALPGRTRLPVIAMTADATEAHRRRYLAAGMDDYLAKPLTPESVAEMLARYAHAAR